MNTVRGFLARKERTIVRYVAYHYQKSSMPLWGFEKNTTHFWYWLGYRTSWQKLFRKPYSPFLQCLVEGGMASVCTCMWKYTQGGGTGVSVILHTIFWDKIFTEHGAPHFDETGWKFPATPRDSTEHWDYKCLPGFSNGARDPILSMHACPMSNLPTESGI